MLTTVTGIQVVLFGSCVTILYSQYSRSLRSSSSYLIKGDKRALLLLSYITLLFVIESIYTAVQARTVQLMYIDNRNYPGGPWAYFLATQNLPVNVMFYATLFVLTFLSDLLVVSVALTAFFWTHLTFETIALALLGHLDSFRAAYCRHRGCVPYYSCPSIVR